MEKPQLLIDLGIEGCFNFEKDAWIFQDVIKRVNPSEILETGFFTGLSSFAFLYLSKANIISVDPMVNLYDPNIKHDGKIENVQKLKDAFPNRFTFIQKDSCFVRPDLKNKQFDLFFIDGDHLAKGIRNDLQLALDLNIEHVLLDDFVTSVLYIYYSEFQNEFEIMNKYDRYDTFMGKPIPMVLLRNKQI